LARAADADRLHAHLPDPRDRVVPAHPTGGRRRATARIGAGRHRRRPVGHRRRGRPGPVHRRGRTGRKGRVSDMFGIDLPVLWFILVAFLFAGYFLLEGFDFGIGILLPILGRDEARRSAMLRTIGPVWDGNEVWLITAGGALFAAFPEWYA